MSRPDWGGYSPAFNIEHGRCPACGGTRNYRMIVTVENKWRSLCGDTFHAPWFVRVYRVLRGTEPIQQVRWKHIKDQWVPN